MYSRSLVRLQVLQDEARQSSLGKRMLRGIAWGGLAGGILGFAIEMSPEEYGLKRISHEWIERGKAFFDRDIISSLKSPMRKDIAGPIPAPSKPEQERIEKSWSKQPNATEVERSRPQQEVDSTNIKGLDGSDDEGDTDMINEEDTDEEEQVIESVDSKPGEQASSGEPEGLLPGSSEVESEELTSKDGGEAEIEPVDEQELIEEVKASEKLAVEEQELIKLRTEVERLRGELVSLKTEHEREMVTAAGTLQGTLDTLDRLYNERETAISVAKHGILVNEMLYSMALDKTSTSAGAIRVDLENRTERLVRDCFTPADPSEITFFRQILGRSLAAIYNTRGGEFLTKVSISESPTWENLCAVQVARAAAARGDFALAIAHLETLDHSECAREWVEKARQVQIMLQGAEAAVASLHDDLLKVI
jgi:hypothetical protein